MATKSNLMGLGLPAPLANRMADAPDGTAIYATATGSSQGSAYQIPGAQAFTVVTATGTGQYLSLPSFGGDNGALVGDNYIILNMMTTASVVVCAPLSTAGSASAIIITGSSSTAGSTGTSVSVNRAAVFYAITSSTWFGMLS